MQNAKNSAIDEINAKATTLKFNIDNLTDLDSDQIANMKQKVDDAATLAKTAINSANDLQTVSTEKDNGIASIDLNGAKAEGINEVFKDAKAKKASIDSMENLSADEKVAQKGKVDDKALAAVNEINSAADTDAIDTANDNDIAATDLLFEKSKAIDNVNLNAQTQKFRIRLLAFISNEKKSEEISKIDTLLSQAKENINNADSIETITPLEDSLVEDATDVADAAVANDFIKGYISNTSDNIYNNVNSTNSDQIFSGKTPWDELSSSVKDLVNAAIENSTDSKYSTYEDYVLAQAKFTDDSSDDFINNYLYQNGKLIKSATVQNYQQIISAKSVWDKLSQSEKDAVDAKLTALGSKTYEQLYDDALNVTLPQNPKTGEADNGVILFVIVIDLLSVVTLVFTKRREDSKVR